MSGYDFDLRAWARNPVNLASTLMIWGGLAIATYFQAYWAFWIFGIGLLGPTILREMGVMRWEDEFQREVTTRAALHALLAVAALLAAVMAINGFGGRYNGETAVFDDAIPASSALFLTALTWYMSRLIQYWGVRKAAFRIWGITGLIWLTLVLVGLITIEHMRQDLTVRKLLQMLLPALPLLGLCLLVVRRPRLAGWGSLAFLGSWMIGQEFWRSFTGNIPWVMQIDMLVLGLAPLAAPAVALVVARKP